MARKHRPAAKHHLRRGDEHPNPIQLAKLKIRFVYPPYSKRDNNSVTADPPAQDLEYSLNIDGMKPLKGKTDGQGLLQVEVPANLQDAKLTLYSVVDGKKCEFWSVDLKVMNLGTVRDSLPGECARLNNLGLFANQVPTEDAGDRYMRARVRFIGAYGVPDGQKIEDRIEEVYGS